MTSPNKTIILGGPGDFDLAASLFRSTPQYPCKVQFRIDSGRRKSGGPRNTDTVVYDIIFVVITSLSRTGLASEFFEFEGISREVRGKIRGEYSTIQRTGWYEKVPEDPSS